MAQETNIAWTDASVNFVIGCTPCGPGCELCYASLLAKNRWGIIFGPGGERRETKSGFTDPLRWDRAHHRGQTMMGKKPVPRWVFACSLSDFFDKEWPEDLRRRAWGVIRETPTLYWQIVTKRIGLVPKYLPEDWLNGRRYPHVGFISTQVNQEEVDRDLPKLLELKNLYGARWVGLSIEPQIGKIELPHEGLGLDWVIVGGESNQGAPAREFRIEWAQRLIDQCAEMKIPIFIKQLGDHCTLNGLRWHTGRAGGDLEAWPASLRVRQMPRIYDGVDYARMA